MKKFMLLICLFVMIYSSAFAQKQIDLDIIKQIRLLESNQDDVRRVLTSYELEPEKEYYYDRFSIEDVAIRVDYSEGNCEESIVDGFEVPQWKAIYILIEPSNPIRPEDLNINFSKYKKEKRYHDIDGIYVYYDKQAGIIFTVQDGKIGTIEFIPPSKYNNLMCDKEKAKKLSATSSIFEDELKDRNGIISCRRAIPNVSELNLSKTVVKTNCDSSNSKESEGCSQDAKKIDIVTVTINPDNDVLTYLYTVSDGKIIGTGTKVVWNLSDVKPGIYTITAAVDNGCGFCGKSLTKQVEVNE